MQSLSHSLSVARFPRHSVRNKSECAHTMQVGMLLVVRPYVHYIYSDKHTSTHEEIKISPPNLPEGSSFHSPIIIILYLFLLLFNSITGQAE